MDPSIPYEAVNCILMPRQEVTKLRHRVRNLLEEAAEVAKSGREYVLQDTGGKGNRRALARKKLLEVQFVLK